MARLMRCLYCGVLQDEPAGAKSCARCGGELAYEDAALPVPGGSYLYTQLELDQVQAPSGHSGDRFLLLTLRTPPQVPPEHAAPGGRPSFHFAAVMDVSGSMAGEKIDQVKEALRRALDNLGEHDAFSLVTFSETPQVRQSPAPCTAALRKKMQALVDELSAGGLTALDGGLALGIEQALREQRETNLVLLLSDGQANVGETDLEKIGVRAARARQQGLQVSTLGVGLDYNEALMVEIATQGGGRFYHILEAAQIPACLMQELGDASLMGAREVTIELDLPPGATVVALSAVFPVEQNGNTAHIQVGDIPLDTTLEIVLRLTFPSQPAGARLSVSGHLRYLSPAGHELGGALNGVTVRIVEASQFERRQGLALPVVERVAEYRRAAWVLDYARRREVAPAEAPRLAEEASRDLLEYAGLVSEEKRAAFARDLTDDMDVLASPAPAPAKARVLNMFKIVRGD